MKIIKIGLENFKRFTKLEIDNIADSSKLVVIIGSNGSGKSSLFDAFGFFDAAIIQDVGTNEEFWNYFRKRKESSVSVTIHLGDNTIHTVSDRKFNRPLLTPQSFYGRTSFRQIPRLTRTSLGQGGRFDFENDSDRPRFFI